MRVCAKQHYMQPTVTSHQSSASYRKQRGLMTIARKLALLVLSALLGIAAGSGLLPARHDELIERLAALPPVPGALDQIVQRFGADIQYVFHTARHSEYGIAPSAIRMAWPFLRMKYALPERISVSMTRLNARRPMRRPS